MPDKWTYIDLDWDMDLQICKAIFQSIPSPLPHSTPMRSNLIPDPGQQNKPNQVESGVQMWIKYSFPQFKRETIEGYNISIISSEFQKQ